MGCGRRRRRQRSGGVDRLAVVDLFLFLLFHFYGLTRTLSRTGFGNGFASRDGGLRNDRLFVAHQQTELATLAFAHVVFGRTNLDFFAIFRQNLDVERERLEFL